MLILKLLLPAILVFNSVRGLSGFKAISKCEANQTSSFQDIAFTNICGQTDGPTDGRTEGQGHSIIRPVFRRAYKRTTITNYLFTFENYRYDIFIPCNTGLICGPFVLC